MYHWILSFLWIILYLISWNIFSRKHPSLYLVYWLKTYDTASLTVLMLFEDVARVFFIFWKLVSTVFTLFPRHFGFKGVFLQFVGVFFFFLLVFFFLALFILFAPFFAFLFLKNSSIKELKEKILLPFSFSFVHF